MRSMECFLWLLTLRVINQMLDIFQIDTILEIYKAHKFILKQDALLSVNGPLTLSYYIIPIYIYAISCLCFVYILLSLSMYLI